MQVLIAGCGYVGVALGAELARQGHEVSGLNRTAVNRANLETAGINSLIGDITKPDTLLAHPDTWDWVVDCVSASGGGAQQYREAYLDGTLNLLAWLAKSPPQKFIFTSSTSVYGQNDGSVVSETSPTEPEPESARVLVATETMLLEAAGRRRFPSVVLRVSGIYGPQRGYWLRQFVRGEARIEGDGKQIVNMIHRDDVAGAIIAALQKGAPGEIYNVTDDEPVSQKELFTWLSQKLQKPLPPPHPSGPHPTRKRTPTNKRISNGRLKRELGYQLLYPTFREGFAELISTNPRETKCGQ